MGCGKDSGDTLWILDKFGSFSQRVAGGWETKLSLNHGNGLFVDKQDNVWILLGNSGLLRYKAGELKNWSNVLNPDAEDYIPGHNLFDMVQNGDGLYWVASDYGLFRFDGTSFLQAFNAENSGIASRRTRCLAIGRDGALWIGTWDGGVSKFDGANWVNYNVKIPRWSQTSLIRLSSMMLEKSGFPADIITSCLRHEATVFLFSTRML